MRETQRPTSGYMPLRNVPDVKDRFSVPVPNERLDELLIELFLVDTVACIDPCRSPLAERLIERFLTPAEYNRVMEHYDDVSDDDDDEVGLVEFVFCRAATKDSHWKSKMLRWFAYIVGGGRPLSNEGYAEVATLAAAMGASQECQALFKVLRG